MAGVRGARQGDRDPAAGAHAHSGSAGDARWARPHRPGRLATGLRGDRRGRTAMDDPVPGPVTTPSPSASWPARSRAGSPGSRCGSWCTTGSPRPSGSSVSCTSAFPRQSSPGSRGWRTPSRIRPNRRSTTASWRRGNGDLERRWATAPTSSRPTSRQWAPSPHGGSRPCTRRSWTGRLIAADQLAELSAVAFEGTDQVFGNPARLGLGYPLGRIGATGRGADHVRLARRRGQLRLRQPRHGDVVRRSRRTATPPTSPPRNASRTS